MFVQANCVNDELAIFEFSRLTHLPGVSCAGQNAGESVPLTCQREPRSSCNDMLRNEIESSLSQDDPPSDCDGYHDSAMQSTGVRFWN